MIGLFNIFVDYAGIFSLRKDVSRIDLRTDNRRIVLPGIISTYQPECIITGTSRVGRSINPLYKTIANKKCMNLFLNAGDAYEISKVLEYANNVVPNLKEIYLGLDFFMFSSNLDVHSYQSRFNEDNYTKTGLIRKILSNFNFVISKDAIKNNLFALMKDKIDFHDMQEMSFQDRSPNRKIADLDAVYSYALQVWNVMQEGGHGYYNYKLSDSKIESIVSVLKELTKRNVKVNIIVNPVHVFFAETIERSGYLDEYAKIIESVSALTDKNITVFDFSGYNSVTTQHYYEDFNCYPDAGHFSVEIGNAIIDIIEDSVVVKDGRFGHKLNHISASEYILEQEAERNKWLLRNKSDENIITEVLKCVKEGGEKSCVSDIVLKNYIPVFNKKRKVRVKQYNKCVDISPKITHSYSDKINQFASTLQSIKKKQIKNINTINKNKEMIYIPKGRFFMGADVSKGLKNERPLREVFLNDFYIDKNETTKKEFLELGLKPKVDYGYDVNTAVSGVTWWQAKLYCEALGKRLPTEAEWEKAGRGNTTRRFPWGEQWPDCELANFNGDPGVGCGRIMPGIPGERPKGASPYGVLDMAGNVFEFVSDSYTNKITSNVVPENGTAIIKGGSFYSEFQDLRISLRRAVDKEYARKYIGFRCVKSTLQ